ncbi:MAG: hypothetical protein R3C09_25070 [Pirellulaceae bacterium]
MAQRIEDDEAVALLSAMSTAEQTESNDDQFRRLFSASVNQLLEAWTSASSRLMGNDLCYFPLFFVQEFSGKSAIAKYTRICVSEISQALDEKRLFSSSGQVLETLQACLKDVSVLYIFNPHQALKTALKEQIPQDTNAECFPLLNRRPELVDELEPRIQLLKQLASDSEVGDASSLRYLLHRQNTAEADNCDLFAIGDDAWSKLTEKLLVSTNQGWRGIPSLNLRNLTPSVCHVLSILACDGKSVSKLSSTIQLDSVDLGDIASDPNWYRDVVRGWPTDGDAILKKLPIFKTTNGSFVGITPETFINVGFAKPPSEIFPRLQLIEDPEDLISNRRLANQLNSNGILRQILHRDDCHMYWHYVLNQLDGDLDADLKNLVRTTPWLATLAGKSVSPDHVVAVDSLAAATDSVSKAGGKLVHKSCLTGDLLSHPNWMQTESDFCLKGMAMVKVMANEFASLPDYQIGVNGWREGRVDTFVELLSEMPTPLPGVELVSTLCALPNISLERLEQELFPKLSNRIQLTFAPDVLNYIRVKHETASAANRNTYLQIHDAFLDEALSESRFIGHLEHLYLRSQAGEWTWTTELAQAGHNISEHNLIHS